MRILCLPYTHTYSHLSRPLAVAEALRSRGHEVVFAGKSPKVRLLAQQGFTVQPLDEPDPDVLFGNIRAGRLRFIEERELRRLVEADVALFRELRPQVVLSDGRFSAPIAAQIAGVRHAAIVNVSSTAYRANPYVPLFDKLPTWLVARDARAWGLLERLNLFLEMRIFDQAMPFFERICRQHKLRRGITATTCLTGADLTLLADVPEYFPTRNLPADHRYVGPLTWKGHSRTPAWWPPAEADRPLVYMTMGTTGVANLFEELFATLARTPYHGIITTGGQVSGLPEAPRIHTEEFIDGDMVMEHCDVVICHGGNGTIYQALSHGRPVIGLPTIPDQAFNMRRVQALGLGETLDPRQFLKNPALLLNALDNVLRNPGYATRAAAMGRCIATYDAASLAATAVEQLGAGT